MGYAEKKAAKRNGPYCFYSHFDKNNVPEPRIATKLAGSPPVWVCENHYEALLRTNER